MVADKTPKMTKPQRFAIRELTKVLGEGGVGRVLNAAANALRALPQNDEEEARLSRLAGIKPVGEGEAAEIAARITVRSMEMRKARTLSETLSSATAAEILGVSAQTVRNRMPQQGRLLAVASGVIIAFRSGSSIGMVTMVSSPAFRASCNHSISRPLRSSVG